MEGENNNNLIDYTIFTDRECFNCKYYDAINKICLNKSNEFHKFNVNPTNHCGEFEFSDDLKMAYECVYSVIERYMDIPKETIKIISTWIIGARFFHNKFESYPFLFINAMKGSGKSRILKIIKSFTNGDMLNSITEAVLFRTKGCLCIDEFERINDKDRNQLRELLNSAYKKGTKVKRMSKKKGIGGSEEIVVDEFDVYRPIAIANISGMEEVLGDRCLNIVIEKSDLKEKTSLMEIWEKESEFFEFRHLANNITNRQNLSKIAKSEQKPIKSEQNSDVSGDDADDDAQGVYILWNSFILNVTNITNIINITNVTNVTNTKNINNFLTREEKIYRLFNLIKNSNITGRYLEITFPLLLTSFFIFENDESLFSEIQDILNSISKIVLEKQEDAVTENTDVAIYEFFSQSENDIDKNWIFLSDITKDFKLFFNNQEWINEKWFIRALKRLNLIIERRKLGRGVQLRINKEKAKLKVEMFNRNLKNSILE